jgi:hypothetical protein
VGSDEGFHNFMKAHLLLWSLSREGIARSLVVYFKVVSKPSQASSWKKSTTRMLSSHPRRAGFPTNPGVKSLLDEINGGGDVLLGWIVGRDLLLLSTKWI